MGVLRPCPCATNVAATSVGIVDGEPMLDLCYEEDSRADVDMIWCSPARQIHRDPGHCRQTPFDDAGARRLMELGPQVLRACRTPEAGTLRAMIYCATTESRQAD